MKKIFSLLLGLILLSTTAMPVLAADSKDTTSADEIYQNVYEQCSDDTVKIITDDYSAYTYLLNHTDQFAISNNRIALLDISLASSEVFVLNNFVERLNTLLEIGAIEIDHNLMISTKDAPTAVDVTPTAAIFEILGEARAHARELQRVYDNAIFGTAHVVAGEYFAQRVKSNGVWDYKRFLGTNTPYYEPELGSMMTGETIGNFHYGYVGSAVFAPFTLKSAAGFVQIYSGTSDYSFWKSYWDDPKDIKDIEWGISQYNRDN